MEPKNWELVGKLWAIGLALLTGGVVLVRFYDKMNEHVASEEPKVESLQRELTGIESIAKEVGKALKLNSRIDAKQEAQLNELIEQNKLEEERIKVVCSLPESKNSPYCKSQEVKSK